MSKTEITIMIFLMNKILWLVVGVKMNFSIQLSNEARLSEIREHSRKLMTKFDNLTHFLSLTSKNLDKVLPKGF